MDNSNKSEFKATLDGLSEYYQKPVLSVVAMQLYFASLEEYDISQIHSAIGKHLKNPKNGQFYPKAADLAGHIEGGVVTADMVLAAARLKRCPMGVLAAMHIGSYDLEHNNDPFYLKQRAEECIQLIPEWKHKMDSGDITDHTVDTLLKYGVSPTQPFREGLAPPVHSQDMANRIGHSQGENTKRLAIASQAKADEEAEIANRPISTPEEIKENMARMKRMLGSISAPPPEWNLCTKCVQEYNPELNECPNCQTGRNWR